LVSARQTVKGPVDGCPVPTPAVLGLDPEVPTKTAFIVLDRRSMEEVVCRGNPPGFSRTTPGSNVSGVIVGRQVSHHDGAMQVPGQYLLGLPWQTRRGSTRLGIVGTDAARLADRVVAH
jgi:hypothetical protein